MKYRLHFDINYNTLKAKDSGGKLSYRWYQLWWPGEQWLIRQPTNWPEAW